MNFVFHEKSCNENNTADCHRMRETKRGRSPSLFSHRDESRSSTSVDTGKACIAVATGEETGGRPLLNHR